MSQYFDLGDETLWNPATGVARVFLRHVALFEDELGIASGIGPMVADECQVDPVAYGAFANALLAWHRAHGHTVLVALSEGFVATALALAERARIEVRWDALDHALREDPATWQAELREKVAALMPAVSP
ncbi:DUF6086 family protein [Streptomyces sp. NPDC019396]|uniref:DUF6086 family protein n=1 Tax=Streptomyces sp. NPDC019396 TaxID=3154687 RepID=UPI0033DCACB5